MSRPFCPECGSENPGEARFCMHCGTALGETPVRRPAVQSPGSGTDWAALVAAMLAFLSLRKMSRQARQTTIVVAVLLIFFGCPMACGFAMFVVDSVLTLFQ